MNQNINMLEFTCKECNKKYIVNYKDVRTIPLWKYESCSKACAKLNTKNKFVILKSKTP